MFGEKSLAQHVPIDPVSALEALEEYGAVRTLLTVWPSYNESWPAQAVKEYTKKGGQTIIYVGEGSGGCTADNEFHDFLEDEKGPWELKECIDIPVWEYIHDRLYIYVRKS